MSVVRDFRDGACTRILKHNKTGFSLCKGFLDELIVWNVKTIFALVFGLFNYTSTMLRLEGIKPYLLWWKHTRYKLVSVQIRKIVPVQLGIPLSALWHSWRLCRSAFKASLATCTAKIRGNISWISVDSPLEIVKNLNATRFIIFLFLSSSIFSPTNTKSEPEQQKELQLRLRNTSLPYWLQIQWWRSPACPRL